MSDDLLHQVRHIIQEDVGQRGLRTDPAENLITACADDFLAACRSLAATPDPAIGVVTGFFIPHADPPAGETDGPLGALFLARALVPLGFRVVLLTDAFCAPALAAGIAAAGLRKSVPLVTLPGAGEFSDLSALAYWQAVAERTGLLTHVIALERVGPSHTPHSVASQAPALRARFASEVPVEHHDRCHTMRGLDITEHMSPAHLLFEAAARQGGVTTIGIGDGGNEIGMGKIDWHIIDRNIPRGGLVACRIPTDHLVVCGVSNWGAYGLAAGVHIARGHAPEPDLFDIGKEADLLEHMVKEGPLVDGVSGQTTATVDGLSFERYVEPLGRISSMWSPQRGAWRPERRAAAVAQSCALVVGPDGRETGKDVRRRARSGELTKATAGLALGYVQANLVVVARELAFDFLLFCQRNPKPCPLLDVTEPGSAEPKYVAPGADLRTDLPRYCVYEHGNLLAEPTDVHDYWRKDLVGFLLGCSYTFEKALLDAGLPLRHLEMGCNVPMYRTNIACRPAGVFHGPMVVSMRPMTPAQAIAATRVTGRFPRAHGAPIHIGDPQAIGIHDLHQPHFGDAVEIRPGEVPVFWACGVTPQAVAMDCHPPFLITHKPGHMFVTDLRDTELED